MRTIVAIVGGGLAGLYAARLLHTAGIDFQLLEARDRLGGRILSLDSAGVPSADGFDLGPSWFWPDMQPAMGALARELGLAAFPQHSAGDVLFERMSKEPIHRFQSMRQEPASMRFSGGTGALVKALATTLPPERLHLGATVTNLTLLDDGVALTIAGADALTKELIADHLILALPPRLLARTIAFDPPVEQSTASLWQGTATWMAPHAKFLALYDQPFWRNEGLSGTAQSVLGPLVEIHDATTASGAAALFGFIGVNADQRSSIGEDALVHACFAQLGRLFGPEAARPRATLFKDWAADPLTATEADRVGGAHPTPGRMSWVTGAWSKRLSLGGSETSAREPGYLAGAVDAAERAVAEIRTRLVDTRETMTC
ncbi:NAD(P)-binding protein [Altererythrobacter indicus]|uniref:NAD(P)-binding protein n=1 Tax=Altericroceibacterium indicum TaxID=374177 RepID=A0A845AE40_9SPHN|nr:FAD-dependent oxidoreductase [Altericroceibacterium indicum]MXP26816.1 NAD(P)-binding protein [Altericroceibacterium indicum]